MCTRWFRKPESSRSIDMTQVTCTVTLPTLSTFFLSVLTLNSYLFGNNWVHNTTTIMARCRKESDHITAHLCSTNDMKKLRKWQQAEVTIFFSNIVRRSMWPGIMCELLWKIYDQLYYSHMVSPARHDDLTYEDKFGSGYQFLL